MPSQIRPNPASLADRLRDIVDPGRVLDGAGTAKDGPLAIRGLEAPLQVRPAHAAQMGSVLALAQGERLGVCIAGGATKLQWGNRPERFDLLVGTGGLCSTSAVDADDLTMTVSAGVTLAQARAQARAMDRVLPLDGGRPSLATIGGIIATGDQGAREAGYGRVRDLVLGLKATLADGTPVAFGGRTMKNVAGYDMTKLFTGSFGVLGVITEITVRLLPRSDTQALQVFPLPSLWHGRDLAARIMGSSLQPLVLEVVSPRLAASLGAASPLRGAVDACADSPLLLAGFAGHPAAVARSLADVGGWSGPPTGAVLGDSEAESVFEALAEQSAATYAPAPGDTFLAARAFAPVSRVWELAEAAESSAAQAGLRLAYRIGAARGTLDLWVDLQSPDDQPSEPFTAWVVGLRTAATAAGGQLALTSGSVLASAGLDAWGELGPTVRIMRRIKERFDPHRTLNPGRFVGGI